MSLNAPLHRREREQGVHAGLEPANEGKHSQRESRTAQKSATAPKAAHKAAPGATWTPERVEQLKGCIRAGLTCSRIAAEIGVSRNAVIGKMNRLGLSRPKVARARGSELAGEEPKRAAWRSRNVTRLFTQHRILVELPPAPRDATLIANGRGCSLLELNPGNCRWPISEAGAADFRFCGGTQVAGLPYCVGHARLAYKVAGRNRD